MKILLLEDRLSRPPYSREACLVAAGHQVTVLGMESETTGAFARRAQTTFDHDRPDVLVGHGRGGNAALSTGPGRVPLVLLSPMWSEGDFGNGPGALPVIILHSSTDPVVSFSESEAWMTRQGLPLEALIDVGMDHRMEDPGSLSALCWAVELVNSIDAYHTLFPGAGGTVAQEMLANSSAEGHYVCDGCGEEIVIPIDASEGDEQEFVEDCPVCCRANVIRVHVGLDGRLTVQAAPEQDRY